MSRRRWYLNKWVVLLYIVAAQMGWGIYIWQLDFSLWAAARGGDRAAVEERLNRGANPDSSWLGLSALGAALFRQEKQISLLLLRRGADPNLAVRQFVWYADTEIVAAMVARGLNANSEIGSRALIIAAKNNKPEMVKILLQRGANPFAIDDDTGDTVLQIAKKQTYHNAPGSAQVLSLLRSAAGKEPGTLYRGGRLATPESNRFPTTSAPEAVR